MTEILQGIDQISEYCRKINIQYSIPTIMDSIRFRGFPAQKLGGRWTADPQKISRWARGEDVELPKINNKSIKMQHNRKNAKKRK